MTNAQTFSRGAAIVDGAFELHDVLQGRRIACIGSAVADEVRPPAP